MKLSDSRCWDLQEIVGIIKEELFLEVIHDKLKKVKTSIKTWQVQKALMSFFE